MHLPNASDLDAAAAVVYAAMPPTLQYNWPQLDQTLGAEAWVKHENHTPTGAFKVRGGLVYVDALLRRQPGVTGIISATRGNHGQSLAFAARRHGLPVTIVVPYENSREKNTAMRALGAELIEHGNDFQASREYAQQLAERDGLHLVPSFHPDLVAGVATGWMELLRAQPELDLLLVPIGQGSGICAAVAARRALGLKTRIVGVVSQHAPAYLASFRARRPVEAPAETIIADGLACRTPDPASLEIMLESVDDVLAVTDNEIAAAMRLIFRTTHNVAEGAGAAALAAALQIKDGPRIKGRRIGLPMSGANVDTDLFRRILRGD